MIGMGKYLAPPVIYDDDMIFAPFTRFAIVGGISRNRLSRSRTGQEPGKYPHCIHIGNNLFKTESGNIQGRTRSSHIRIPFVGTHHYIPGRRYGKVCSCHGSFRIQKDISQILTGGMCQISRIRIPFLRTHLFFEKLSHLLTLNMNGRQHDMTGRQMHQLQNTLT